MWHPSVERIVDHRSTRRHGELSLGRDRRRDALVIEAGVSRIYAGLHYRFDVSAGQEIGTNVARLAIARSPKEKSAIPLN